MNPLSVRRVVRELEIKARLEAKLDYKMRLVRCEPPADLNDIFKARYMKAYKEAYDAFRRIDEKD